MKKHTIVFTLPEDQEDLNTHLNAGKYHNILWEMAQFLRSKIKYTELTDEESKIYTEIREKFYELIQEAELTDSDL